MPITKSARLFLERKGLRPTWRPPTAQVAPSDLPQHRMTLTAPLASVVFDGDPPPDRGNTKEPWPGNT